MGMISDNLEQPNLSVSETKVVRFDWANQVMALTGLAEDEIR